MFTLPGLPYSYEALEPYIDTETMHIHHDKHHATYVNNLNDVLKDHKDLLETDVFELIKNLDKVPQDLRTKVTNNGGGHANHSIFWTVMGPNGGGEPKGELADALKGTFGDFSTFKEKFSAAGVGRFGSGWVWLVMNNGKLDIVDTGNQDSPISAGKFPILTLDVWEHAYYLKYQNRRADYIAAWWNVINWEEVARRFKNAETR